MTEEEIYEELEITYGKPPRTTSEKNMIWLKGVLEEHIIEGEFNEDVPKPSLDALAMTLIAITTYDIPMEELAAKKPAIKRTLLWFWKISRIRSAGNCKKCPLKKRSFQRTLCVC